MIVTPLALAVLVWTQAGAGANAAQPASDLALRVQAQIEFTGGRTQVTAWENDAQEIDTYIYVTSQYCGLGTSSTLPATTPAAGWHVSARVVARTGDSRRVLVQWQRMWDRAAGSQRSATGVSMNFLKSGDQELLDTITPDATPSCGAASIRLTASIEHAAVPVGSGRGGADRAQARAGSVGAGASPIAGGGARGGGGGGGAGIISAGASGGGSLGGARAGGGTGGGAAFEPAAPGSVAAVDLWLLDRAEDSGTGAFVLNQRYRMVSLAGGGSDFTFDPLILNTARGEVMVRLTGRLVPVITNGRLTSIDVQITRAVKGDAIDVTGGATQTLTAINSTDVVSFELPSGERDDPSLLGSHHLSLRVRVR